MKLSEIPYERPNLDELQKQYQDLQHRFTSATTSKEQLDVIEEWNDIRIDLATLSSLVHIRFSQNITDEWAKGEKDFFDQHGPTMQEWNTNLVQEIVKSPFVSDIEQEWGALFLEKLRLSLETFKPEIKDELIEESRLTQKIF